MPVPIPSESLIGPVKAPTLEMYCVRYRAVYWKLWRDAVDAGFPTLEARRYGELEIQRMLDAGELSRDIPFPLIPDDTQVSTPTPGGLPGLTPNVLSPLRPNPAHAPKKLVVSPLVPKDRTIASVCHLPESAPAEIETPRFSFLKPKVRYAHTPNGQTHWSMDDEDVLARYYRGEWD